MNLQLLSTCSTTRLFLLLVILVEFGQGNERTHPELEVPSNEFVTKDVGERLRLNCPILQFSNVRWMKDNKEVSLEIQKHVRIRKNTKLLKFLGLKISDSGSYSCDIKVNGTWSRVKTWKIDVSRLTTDSPQVCGEPMTQGLAPYCLYERNLTKCKSFPGRPRNINVVLFLHRDLPAIQVQWDAPLTGFGDLQGYAVLQLGFRGHVNHQQCYQINSKLKPELMHITFHTSAYQPDEVNVLFGASYLVKLTSLPSNDEHNSFSKRVNVPEKCAWTKFQDLPECYAVSNLTATVEHVNEDIGWKITVTWNRHLKHNNSIAEYVIYGTTYPDVYAFYNETTVKGSQNRTSLTIPPSTGCSNLTVTVAGKTAEGMKTKEARIKLPNIGACPTSPPVSVALRKLDDRTLKIAVIVGSVMFSIMLVAVFYVIYRYYYKPVVLRLPAVSPSNGDPTDPILDEEQQKRRVYIMHSYCCEKCNWAVIQFGDVLRSTELIEVGLDLWDTLEMLPNKPLYYEKRIRESDCVVVIADSAMKDCASSPKKPFDGKYARFQLDLIRGEITSRPDTRKYVPVFMSFNSTKKDIPDFLSSRLSHALPEEIDRVVFHLLNIERIQPRRRRMIAVIGGNDHPYDEAKKRFEAALDTAERHHLGAAEL